MVLHISESKSWNKSRVNDEVDEDLVKKNRENLVDDPTLRKRIEEKLPNVSRLVISDLNVDVADGEPVSMGLYSDNEENERILRTFARQNYLAISPLFDWLLDQPKQSVDQIQLFNQAVEIYKDPWVALGIIGVMGAWDSGNYAYNDRSKYSIALSKIKTPFLTRPAWHAGVTYHFWSFIIRQIILPTTTRTKERFFSYLYETVLQGDNQERNADVLGSQIGLEIREMLRQRRSCEK